MKNTIGTLRVSVQRQRPVLLPVSRRVINFTENKGKDKKDYFSGTVKFSDGGSCSTAAFLTNPR